MNDWTAQIQDLSRHVDRNAGLAALPEYQRNLRLDVLRVRGDIVQRLRTAPKPMSTLRIALDVGISDEGARRHLLALADEGMVERTSGYPARWRCATANV